MAQVGNGLRRERVRRRLRELPVLEKTDFAAVGFDPYEDAGGASAAPMFSAQWEE